MAIVIDSFLEDLEELSDNEDLNLQWTEEGVGELADDLDNVCMLQKSRRYSEIMQKVEDALAEEDVYSDGYQLLVDCIALSVDIDNEILTLHNFIRDKYRLKFPELESLVHHPIDYARVVKKIGNAMDMTLVDLEGLLPSAVIMVVSVTASTTIGKQLPQDVLVKTTEACDRALELDLAKQKVLAFVESRMGYIAPNLCAVVGSAVAAKIIATAGGLSSLASIPGCNVKVLGAKRKNLAGFSSATSQFHIGYLEQTEVFQSTPPSLRKQACKFLAEKSILAARVDLNRGHPTGNYGRDLRGEVLKKLEKLQEPPPAKQPKPLLVPHDFAPKKNRGGDRHRKKKERYEMTDTRKLANRIQFGVAEESSLGDGLGVGYGMLGQAGCCKLRLSVGQNKKFAPKIAKKFKRSGAATSGLISCLAFTPVQGIELPNPQAKHVTRTRSTYFSETAMFPRIKRT